MWSIQAYSSAERLWITLASRLSTRRECVERLSRWVLPDSLAKVRFKRKSK